MYDKIAQMKYNRSPKGKEKNHRNEQTPKRKYSVYKRSAKKRNYPFALTFEEFMTFWQKPCSYCGNPINTIGLDRVDNSMGYSLDNIVSCCFECNEMKNNYTKEELLIRCRKILDHAK